MKFNHISFPSRDVTATSAFFERYLECSATAFGTSRILKRRDFDIVIEDGTGRAGQWPDNFHIGFELPTLDALRELYGRLLEDGVRMHTELIGHVRGSRFFCWIPGDFLLEVNTREDAAEPYRSMFFAERA
jgi:catechol 2,3-dioxygenase-like lactoylglutathione lyase family enzyme